MVLLNAVVIAGVLIIIMLLLYRMRNPKEYPEKKPAFAMLPKYRLIVKLSAGSNSKELLSNKLSTLGFKLSGDTSSQIVFSRGSVLGDISIKITKVNLKFDKPLSEKTGLTVEYGAFAFFDTGDLWEFIRELSDKLKS